MAQSDHIKRLLLYYSFQLIKDLIIKDDGLLAGAELVGGVAHVGGTVVAANAMNDKKVTIAGTLRCHTRT